MPIASLQEHSIPEKRTSIDSQTSSRRKRLKRHSTESFGSTPCSSVEEVEVLGPCNLKSEDSIEGIRDASDFQNGSQCHLKTEIIATVSIIMLFASILL